MVDSTGLETHLKQLKRELPWSRRAGEPSYRPAGPTGDRLCAACHPRRRGPNGVRPRSRTGSARDPCHSAVAAHDDTSLAHHMRAAMRVAH
jgi:hypothetical protein